MSSLSFFGSESFGRRGAAAGREAPGVAGRRGRSGAGAWNCRRGLERLGRGRKGGAAPGRGGQGVLGVIAHPVNGAARARGRRYPC